MRNILYLLKTIFSSGSGSANALDYNSYITERIKTMREAQNYTFEEIVDALNNEGLEPLSGRGNWTVRMVENVYFRESSRKFKELRKSV